MLNTSYPHLVASYDTRSENRIGLFHQSQALHGAPAVIT